MAKNKTRPRKAVAKKATPKGDGRWGEGNARLSRDPCDLLARFQEQEAQRYEKVVRIRLRAEKLGDKTTASAAKKIEKKLQSFART